MMICLVRFLRREQVDAIFCPGLTYTAACVVARLVLGKRCPPILVKISNDLEREHAGLIRRWANKLWLRLQGKLLDQFVAIGRPMKAAATQSLAVPNHKVSVIPDPAISQSDLEELSADRVERSEQGLAFLGIGRLVPQKNFELLVDAFARVAGPADHLTIAGEGPSRRSIERRVKANGLGKQVTLCGHVSATKRLYAGSTALVVSSRFEGVPAVVIEGLAAGIPIAATNCCVSMEWLLGAGKFGALAAEEGPNSLAIAMAEAAQLTPCANSMRKFAALFTLERAHAEYLMLLRKLAEAKHLTKQTSAG